jgi:DNA-binding transcriptional regulator PaaX
VCPGNWGQYQEIRACFRIPHDGLRHTAVSAFVAKFGSLANAALEFGNSERIIREAYLRRMSKEEAEAFYGIFPAV